MYIVLKIDLKISGCKLQFKSVGPVRPFFWAQNAKKMLNVYTFDVLVYLSFL